MFNSPQVAVENENVVQTVIMDGKVVSKESDGEWNIPDSLKASLD
jgi:hypothetical protein